MDARVDDKRVQQTLQRLPRTLGYAMSKACKGILAKYQTHHEKGRLHAPPPPVGSGRSGAQGVHGTRKRGGFLKMFKLRSGGATLNTAWAKIYTRNITAVSQEFGASRRAGWIPLPDAIDAEGRVLKQYRKIRGQIARGTKGKAFVMKRAADGKEFIVLKRAGWKKHTRQAARGGYRLKGYHQDIFLFHRSPSRLKPRLSFFQLWKDYHKGIGRQQWKAALREALTVAQGRPA